MGSCRWGYGYGNLDCNSWMNFSGGVRKTALPRNSRCDSFWSTGSCHNWILDHEHEVCQTES